MGTLKVDNLQKRDGTALITDGAASTTLLSKASLKSAGAGMVLLTDTTISSGATSAIFDISTNDVCILDLIRLVHSTAGGANLNITFGTAVDTFTTSSVYSTSFDTTVYSNAHYTVATNPDSGAFIYLHYNAAQWGGGTGEYCDGRLFITGGTYPSLNYHSGHVHNSGMAKCRTVGSAFCNSSSNHTHMKIELSTGTFTSGKMKLYGVS